MNPLRHALNRAFARPVPVIVLAAVDPEPVLPPLIVDPVDRLVYSLGPYASDPRITAIGCRRINLADGSTIRLIAEPDDGYRPYGVEPVRAGVWRMFRADLTTSAFWWPQLVDALDDILGPAQLPTFIPSATLAALAPDSDLLPQEH